MKSEISKVRYEFKRIEALDGLRGLAALAVVLHHHLLTIPWFAEREISPIVNRHEKFPINDLKIFFE